MAARPRNYFIAINSYRTSKDAGFANTWRVYLCATRHRQRDLLTNGLPVTDVAHIDDDGRSTPVSSTNGIRIPTRSERRQANIELSYDKNALQII